MGEIINLEENGEGTILENTRNDRYVIIKKDGSQGRIISYGKHLVNYVNDLSVLSDIITENDFKDSKKFRNLIADLEEKDFFVYQLTRL